MTTDTPKRLGEILVENHCLLPEQLELALESQQQNGHRLGQILIEMGFVSHDTVLAAVSEQTGIPHCDLRKGLVDPNIATILPKETAVAYQAIPMFKVHNVLTLGMADSTNLFAMDDVAKLTGCQVHPVQCDAAAIAQAIETYHSGTIGMDDFLESFRESDVKVVESRYEDLQLVEEMAEGAKIINLVNLIMLNAIRDGASDIHIEPDFDITRVRYRIDGVLQEVMTSGGDRHPAIVSRLKVMAKMDIAERRKPQDGRIHVMAENRPIDLRVSTMPTVLGEKIVVRVLDRGRVVLDLNQIGLSQGALPVLKRLLHRPSGILLVTGPTGSGKTTTLYCALAHISSIEKNVVSIEDPVEYQLDLVNQVQVNARHGLTFASILRAVLRQDPDVVMVGEIRDRETAEVAIQASLTGHLVLATLHTNDSAGAIPRLVEMGIEPYLLTSAITGVVAQRLVRLVCPDCKTNHFPPRELLERIGWEGKNTTFAIGRGCDRCFDSGLRDRTGIYEVLEMDDALRDVILRDPSAQTIQNQCKKSGMRRLKDEAFALVEDGRSTLEEVMRIVFVDEAAIPEL